MERSRLKALLQISQETCRNLASAQQQLSEVLSRTRELVAISCRERILRHQVPCQIAVEPNNFLDVMDSTGLSEVELPAVVDTLIELYQNATALGDEEAAALTARALRYIGHHLAKELGPRESGVLLN
ncbi:hypothetical protein [Aureimonas sp. AU20]|uniref:hypothetical protein n=1 Tax=Aureimonas sp. AU20 TaxID=1349819 RepID=UPI0011DFC87A|nr:hypothetical protein [Aureimonas sp. AU20]